MKNKKKIGFTLVELLAVIVILSIIMTITVPIILVQVKKAEKRSLKYLSISKEKYRRLSFETRIKKVT